MYALLAFVLVVLIVFGMLVLPLHFDALFAHLGTRVRSFTQRTANRAIFHYSEDATRHALLSVRLWFVVSACVFAILGIQDGTVIRNHPGAVATVAGYGALSLTMGSLILLVFATYSWVLPGFRGYATLSRCGFRGLWVLDSRQRVLDLSADLTEQARSTSKIGIIDVNGYELLVRGPGTRNGVLHDVLDSYPHVPVYMLLLNPQTVEMDPDRRMLTVYQSVLSEMSLPAPMYMVRLRKTIATIEALNQSRDPSAQITVRFYSERPTMRAVFFDDSAVVFPPHDSNHDIPCLEIARRSDVPTFYETFRRDFARLWQGGVAQVFAGAG